eukprot:748196-Ditylum_brightwellii.AAC.1
MIRTRPKRVLKHDYSKGNETTAAVSLTHKMDHSEKAEKPSESESSNSSSELEANSTGIAKEEVEIP